MCFFLLAVFDLQTDIELALKSITDYSIFHGFTCKFYLISQSHLVSYSSLFNVIVDNFEFNKIVFMWTAH